jgi:hypothetical protein|tara:strand:- start:1332 stop:1892 length:561 start_codon:yes stop_codon:yes gene_type:complete
MGGWPSTTMNPSGGGRWNNEEDNGYDDNEETTGENVMGTQFMRIGKKLINKSAIVEVIPSFSIEQEIVENPNHKGFWGGNERVVKVAYTFNIGVTTTLGAVYETRLPAMEPHRPHGDKDPYTYEKSYNGETIIDEENYDQFMAYNNTTTGDVVYMTTDYFENNIGSFSNEYAMAIASRYMKSKSKS